MESPHTAYPVHRAFRVKGATEGAHALAAVEQQLPGVERIALDMVARKLTITYNSGAVAFPVILAALAQAGLRPVDSWWFRLKSGWYEYTDRNAAELAHVRPKACCNKVPKA